MNCGMSAIGTKRTSAGALQMSAFGVKRTWRFALQMSANDPKRTFRGPACQKRTFHEDRGAIPAAP
jgi:hypothetical protein